MDQRQSSNGVPRLKRQDSFVDVNRKRRAQEEFVNGSTSYRYFTINARASVNDSQLNPNQRTLLNLSARPGNHSVHTNQGNIQG